MPQINLRIPDEMIEPLDEQVWRLRYKYRNAFIVQAISFFVPDFNYVQLAQFIVKYFPMRVDDLIAELVRLMEKVTNDKTD